MAKNYDKLNKYESYDVDGSRQLAEALNEMVELKNRIDELTDLVADNKELHPFIWRTAQNEAIALQDIKEDHFKNILIHIVNNGRTISPAVKAEARRRGVPIPRANETLLLDGPDNTPTDIDLDDIPF